jgi:hypothetical protein
VIERAAVRYPRKAEIERVVSAVRASGVDVGEVHVCPDGSIKVTEARRAGDVPQSVYDRLEAEGRL